MRRERAWFDARGIAPDDRDGGDTHSRRRRAAGQTRVPITPEIAERRVQWPSLFQERGGTRRAALDAGRAHAVGDLAHSPLLLGEVTLVCGDFRAPLGAIDSQRPAPSRGGFAISPEHLARIAANGGADIVVRLRPEWGVHYPEHRSVFEGEFTVPLRWGTP